MPLAVLRCLFTPAGLSGPDRHDVPWNRRKRCLYVRSALLSEYTRRHDELGVLSLPEPQLGDPLPVQWGGRLISQDLANSAIEANAIERALDGTSPGSIVEAGAGYGRTAHVVLTMFPRASYTVGDIEPALTISRWYLTSLFPVASLRFLRPEEAQRLRVLRRSRRFRLVASRDEAGPGEECLRLFDSIPAGGVVYLKQWDRWTNPVDGVTLAFDEFPVPPRWRLAFDEAAPVWTNFRHAAWCVPSA